MAITVSELIGLVTIRGAEEGIAKLTGVGAASDSAGGKLGLFAGGAALVTAGALALIGAKASEMAGNFQQGINRLKTGGGDIQDSFNSLGNAIKQIAVASGVVTGPLILAMYQIVSANQRGAQAYATLGAAAQGAQIEQANVVDVVKILTTLQTNWGVTTYTATQYMNGLIKAVSQGKLTLEQLSTAMSPILPIAAQMGISFKDVAAAMSVQTNAGLDANRAATGLQAVFVSIEKPTKAASKAMIEFGVNSVDVANMMKTSMPAAFQMLIDAALKVGPVGSVAFNRAMMDMIGGGTRTAKTIDALTQHMKDWTSGVAAIGDVMKLRSKDVDGWALAQSGLNIQLDRAKAAFEVLGITVGQKLLPFLTNLLSLITPIIAGFTTWISSSNGLQRILSMVGDAFQAVFNPIKLVQQAAKPLLDTFDRATAILGSVKQAMQPLTDTFDRAKAILQGTGQVAKPLLDTFDRATAILPPLAGHVKTVQAAFQPLIPILAGVGAILIAVLVPAVWSLAAGVIAATWPLLAIGAAVAGLVAIFMHFYETNAGFKQFILGLVAGARTIIADFVPALKEMGNWFQTRIMPILQQIGSFLVSTFAPVWTQLVSVWNTSILPSLKQLWAALQPLAPVFVAIGGIILGVVVVALGIFVGVIGGVLKALSGLLQGVATVLGGMVQWFTGAVQIISGIIRFFVDLATGNFKNLGKDLGSIWSGIVNMFFGVWNVIKGIFQGAWGAISGFVSGLVEGVIGFFGHLKDTLVGHSIIPDIVNGILTWFGQLPGKLFSLAVQMIQGLINGIWSMAGNFANALGSMVHNAVGNIPGLGGILSGLHILGYEQGGPVLQTGLAMVHRGEYVIPAGGFPAGRMPATAPGGTSAQPIILQINGYTFARLLMPAIVANIRNSVGVSL